MTTDSQCIAQARALLRLSGNETDSLMSDLLKEVCEIAEKRGAALLDERCKCIMLIEKLQSVANDPDWKSKGMAHDIDYYMAQAAKELSLEATGCSEK
jgi:hypothetical protein